MAAPSDVPHLSSLEQRTDEYYQLVLGRQMKQSCCLYPDPELTLDEAEESMLELTCQRAQLFDGQLVLEMSCGWGALSIYMASKYPASRVTAVCASLARQLFVRRRRRQRGLTNLKVVLQDSEEDFHSRNGYHRVMMVETLISPGTYQDTLQRASTWLKPDGIVFIQAPCHHQQCQVSQGTTEGMQQQLTPGIALPPFCFFSTLQGDLKLQQQWYVNGLNYSRTLGAWLQRHNDSKSAVMRCLEEQVGRRQIRSYFARCRLGLLAESVLFGNAQGTTWGVGHYTFIRQTK
ncbi:hypothetical protein ABBQ32_003334 [Trebouxia sp. C0010 RCD-2024]